MHDFKMTLEGQFAKAFRDEIIEAAKEIEFEVDSTEITKFEAVQNREHQHINPKGEEVTVPYQLVLFFWMDVPEGVDYTDPMNASGIEAEMEIFFQSNLLTKIKKKFNFESETNFTEEPKQRADD